MASERRWDDEIMEAFEKAFPEMQTDDKLRKLDENEMKSKQGKERWRNFMTPFEKRIDDYNFGTLIRADCSGDYTEENSIFGEPAVAPSQRHWSPVQRTPHVVSVNADGLAC